MFYTSKGLGIAACFVTYIALIVCSAYKEPGVAANDAYSKLYFKNISGLETELGKLEKVIEQSDVTNNGDKKAILTELYRCRKELKKSDFWTRYLDANAYRSLNGPLPVEWETEVFEKFEKPHKREGHGLSVMENMLDSNRYDKDMLRKMILPSIAIIQVYKADSTTANLSAFDHFFLCNRLFLLNLAAIYTTGFECPDNDSIIPELRVMLMDAGDIYRAYNNSYIQYPLKEEYLETYDKLIKFVNGQPANIQQFDHYTFIRDYVNPLYMLNQEYIKAYKVNSTNLNDYTLNNNASSIFEKDLYAGQNALGIYSNITDIKVINQVKAVGKMLFYDPILSGNNKRSCASCHKPTECFADTSLKTGLSFDGRSPLPRNIPSLVNVLHNHLLMLDGKHISLQGQAKGVITNPNEMGGSEQETVEKVLSCKEYKDAFEKFKNYTYKNKEVTIEHIISAITAYEDDFSDFVAPFDDMMNRKKEASIDCKKGFNLFMGKAQCGTCHYVPEFSGVRPPFVESEFEVIGVPADDKATALDADSGRADIYFSDEMFHAFRTNSLRNTGFTKPYMHNGVFATMQQVLDFYNAGGGAGKGLKVPNQTLSARPLHLSKDEMAELLTFISSLDEDMPIETPPDHLPVSKDKTLNNRKIGGEY